MSITTSYFRARLLRWVVVRRRVLRRLPPRAKGTVVGNGGITFFLVEGGTGAGAGAGAGAGTGTGSVPWYVKFVRDVRPSR